MNEAKHIDGLEEKTESTSPTEREVGVSNKTNTSTAWFMVVSFVVLLVLLLVFILQNLQDVTINLFGFHWNIPLGISLLLTAVLGGFLVALFGTARIVQLRHRARQNKV